MFPRCSPGDAKAPPSQMLHVWLLVVHIPHADDGGAWRSWPAVDSTLVVPPELRQMKVAMGGAQWDLITVISAEGEKTSFGLTGKFHLVEDLMSGAFEARCDYGIFPNAEGMDRLGRWRQDNSGQVHPLDSQEAQEVAVTESYLARHGFFFPSDCPRPFAYWSRS